MRSFIIALLSTFSATTLLAAPSDSEIQRGREMMESSLKSYQAIEAFRDKLSYVVKAPGSEEETKTQEYGFGPKQSVFVRNALLQAVATDGKLYITQTDVPDRYVVAPYDGDFGGVLKQVAGSGSLFEAPPLAMHAGKSLDDCIDTLRFNLLEPLKIAGYRRNEKGEDEVRFVANNGESSVTIDPRSHFFTAINFQVRPPGAPEGFLVRVNGTFSPQVVKGADAVITFDPGSRSAVANLTDLMSTRLTAGSTAPDFELETLAGKKVSLHELRGSVVVLDFWATWCVPCWTALKETQALSSWAAAKELHVAIFPVNTMEQGSDNNAKLERVKAFWKSQKFTMTCLVDPDAKMFKAYGNPGLPSVVVISPTGTILRYHEGLMPNMAETLKKEIQESTRP